MSIQWADNFGSFGVGPSSVPFLISGTPYLYLSSWSYSQSPNGVVSDPDGSGGVCLAVGQNLSGVDASDNQLALPTPVNAVGAAFRWYMPGGQKRQLHFWVDNAQNPLYRLVNEFNGALSIYPYSTVYTTPLATTTIPVLTFNTWWHIETMLDYVLGKITVFVEGIQVLQYSITPSSGTLIYGLGFSPRVGENSGGGSCFMKDYVVYDKNGSINNTVGSIGPCTVYRLALATDISNSWTITGGTTVNGTIGVSPPNDANFISAGTGPIPAGAICGVTPLPSNIVGVRGLVTLQRVQKSDGGDANYQVDLISGSSTHTGTTHSVSTSFNYQFDVVELDPATGEAWSPVAVDNVHVEINRTV